MQIHGYRKLRLRFDWDRGDYDFWADSGVHNHTRQIVFQIREGYYERKFHVPYRAFQQSGDKALPPAGWMTWYALKFDTSEERVLENARWLSRNLRPFGARFLWVDWEWYHGRIFSVGEDPTINTFAPDRKRYPHGMAWLARADR